ncbi:MULTISPECIES: aspartyl-phosphate phosphatase Spo0E family protein [Tissierellales]|nr:MULTISPECIES: aspartyl-phosphate phosphatase Spo0E family protein [Tissierellales]SCL85277.1 Spo0E like sporulation regulatory protein [Sporanaerobacter sp. PP17-6a]
MDKRGEAMSLLRKIENVRLKLYDLINEKGYDLSDEEIVRLSQVLDKLLCQYYNKK